MDPFSLAPPKRSTKKKKRVKSPEKSIFTNFNQFSNSNRNALLSAFDENPFTEQQKVSNTINIEQVPKQNISQNPFNDDFLLQFSDFSPEKQNKVPQRTHNIVASDSEAEGEPHKHSNSEPESDEDLSSTESEKNDEFARKYVTKKVDKIDIKIKKYEEKLKVLHDKRLLYLSQLGESAFNSERFTDESVKKIEYETIDAIQFMRKGSSMLKYGRFGYPHFRHFELSHDSQYLVWYGSKKLTKSRIELRDVISIQKGQLTAIFKKHLQPRLAPCSFSVIYSQGKDEKSLDVITKNKNHFLLWTTALEKLVEYNMAVRNRIYGYGGNDMPECPNSVLVKVVKRDERNIEKRLEMQPQPPKKIVEKELETATKRFSKLLISCNDRKYANVSEMEPVKKRLVELEQDVEKIKMSFENKSLNIASHEIWRTAVELKALEGKIQAISKTYKL